MGGGRKERTRGARGHCDVTCDHKNHRGAWNKKTDKPKYCLVWVALFRGTKVIRKLHHPHLLLRGWAKRVERVPNRPRRGWFILWFKRISRPKLEMTSKILSACSQCIRKIRERRGSHQLYILFGIGMPNEREWFIDVRISSYRFCSTVYETEESTKGEDRKKMGNVFLWSLCKFPFSSFLIGSRCGVLLPSSYRMKPGNGSQ